MLLCFVALFICLSVHVYVCWFELLLACLLVRLRACLLDVCFDGLLDYGVVVLLC